MIVLVFDYYFSSIIRTFGNLLNILTDEHNNKLYNLVNAQVTKKELPSEGVCFTQNCSELGCNRILAVTAKHFCY